MARFEDEYYEPTGSPRQDMPDLICLSHLRWDFVYQRPQHLMTRFARERRVFFFEEPLFDNGPERLDIRAREPGLWIVVPHLPHGLSDAIQEVALESLLKQLLNEFRVEEYILWYYTPMAVSFTRHLHPTLVVYDCMDELSKFKGAPSAMIEYEAELFQQADLVFTGGASIYEAKRSRHPRVYLFPSSIDRAHFGKAREAQVDPPDQAEIPHPRLGFFGVIDERMDVDLIEQIAKARPAWHLIIIGPVVKIAPEALPRDLNIHYLGAKSYEELPNYLSGWDVALLPFARNESTQFISPTKTPEYLAGGKPVVSTPIKDVVTLYGDKGLVAIAGTAPEFLAAIESAINLNGYQARWLAQVDAFLAQTSWDLTWMRMRHLIESRLTNGYKNLWTDSLSTASLAES